MSKNFRSKCSEWDIKTSGATCVCSRVFGFIESNAHSEDSYIGLADFCLFFFQSRKSLIIKTCIHTY